MAEINSEDEKKVPERPTVVRNATDLQRLKLEKLMKNPDKAIIIPEKPKERGIPAVPEFVRNVMGSSAGAGSGEFHVYRHLRRKEYARQKFMKEKGERERLEDDYRQKLEDNKRKSEEKTAKKRAKRLKKKARKRNKTQIIKQEKSESESEESHSDNEDQEETNKDVAAQMEENNEVENSSKDTENAVEVKKENTSETIETVVTEKNSPILEENCSELNLTKQIK